VMASALPRGDISGGNVAVGLIHDLGGGFRGRVERREVDPTFPVSQPGCLRIPFGKNYDSEPIFNPVGRGDVHCPSPVLATSHLNLPDKSGD
jgi:hypothetical protein